MKDLLLVVLLCALASQAVSAACTEFPPLQANQIPSGFTAGVWELVPPGSEEAYHCKDIALAQLHATGPVVAMNPLFRCINNTWEWKISYNQMSLPLKLFCVVPPADFKKECEMYFEFPDVVQVSQIIPLSPAYKYCPDNLPSVLDDGTRFESVACAGSEVWNGRPVYNFDVTLPNGTTMRKTISTAPLRIGCEVNLTCPSIPEIPTNLIPSEYVLAALYKRLLPRYMCGGGVALVQLDTDGPVISMDGPSFDCINGKWVIEDSDRVPVRMSCVAPPNDYDGCMLEYIIPEGVARIVPLLPDFKYCPDSRPSILEDGTPFTLIVCADYEVIGDAYQNYFDVKLTNGTIVRRTTLTNITWFTRLNGLRVSCGEIPTTTTTTVATTTSTKNPNCPPEGVWGEWTETGVCSAICGACANTTRKRVCTNECGNCPCKGPSEDTGPCGIGLCPFPSAATCCKPYVKSLNWRTSLFFCGLAEYPKPVCSSTTTTSTTTVAPTTTTANPNCPPDGVWGEWTEIGTCSATCGACANTTRKRVCTTTCGNCPCKGLSEDVGPCASALCPFPSSVTCCKPYVKSLNQRTRNFFCGTGEYPAPVCSSTTSTSTTSTTTVATTTTIKKDAYATAAQLWNVNFYYNYGVGVHAFCADQTCINAIQSNGIGYDMYNGWGLLGRAVSESAIGAVREACPTGSQNLRNLGFTKSGNKYLHNLSGSGLKQGWVAIASGSCGATVVIKRWKSRYTDDMMYGVDLEWNTWYQGMVQDGGLVQFYMWN